MKGRIYLVVRSILLVALVGSARSLPAADPAASPPTNGVALAIVYDTSGSMLENVPTGGGRNDPKYVVANRALGDIIQRLEQVAARPDAPAIATGLFVFQGQGARAAVPFGPLDAPALRDWLKNFRTPQGSTPLGQSLEVAGSAVLRSPLPRKHLLVITDGQNTAGPGPATIIPHLFEQATQRDSAVLIHFVAFDIDAKVFDPLKNLGVTVVGAANEEQLNRQLEFILEEKILLER